MSKQVADGQMPTRTAGVRPLALATATLAAVVVAYQMLTLDRQGLWTDEVFTVVVSDPARPLDEMFSRYLLPDVHPPLHYLLMRAWLAVAPRADWAMRVPGLVAYVLTLVAASFYPSRGVGAAPRAVFTLLLATSFGTIYFAQEARSYHLVALLAVLVLYDLLDLAVSAGEGGLPGWRRLARSAAIGIALSYTHYFGFLFCGAAVIVLIVAAWPRYGLAWRFAATGAVIAAAFLPWLALHATFLAGRLGGAFWIDNTAGAIVRGFVRHLLSGPVAAAMIAALCLWALARRGRVIVTNRMIWLVIGAVVVNIAVALAIAAHTPAITARNLTGLRIAVLLALALTIAEILSERMAWAAVSVVGIALFVGFLAAEVPRASWREPLAYVRAQTTCAERDILFHDGKGLHPILAGYYLPEARFAFRASTFGNALPAELAALNPPSPGCDVIAVALNLDPTNPAERATLLAATPFRGAGYHVEEWPSALVVRALAR